MHQDQQSNNQKIDQVGKKKKLKHRKEDQRNATQNKILKAGHELFICEIYRMLSFTDLVVALLRLVTVKATEVINPRLIGFSKKIKLLLEGCQCPFNVLPIPHEEYIE